MYLIFGEKGHQMVSLDKYIAVSYLEIGYFHFKSDNSERAKCQLGRIQSFCLETISTHKYGLLCGTMCSSEHVSKVNR